MRKNITTGNYVMNENYNVPMLEILVDGSKVIGYLSPFRGYFFQISKTYDGQHSLGRSDNSQSLKNYLCGNDEYDFRRFSAFSIMAITSCCRTYEYLAQEKDSDISVYPQVETNYDINTSMKTFIEESIKYVSSLA